MRAGTPSWIKSTASSAHRTIARVPFIAALYLAVCRYIIRWAGPRLRQQVLNSMAEAHWPENVLGPREVTLASSTTIRLHPHNGEFDFAAVLGGEMRYEPEVFQFLDSRMELYDVVIEIGANVGVFTTYFGKKLEKRGGRVHAFEPSRRAYGRLLQNVAVNGLKNVFCFGVAVGAETGFTTFYEPEGHLTNGSLVPDFAAQFSDDVMSVPALVIGAAQLSDMVGNGSRVLVKIDVEGFEAPLVRALSPVFKRFRPDVLIEVLPEHELEINAAVSESTIDYLRFAITPQGLQVQERVRAVCGRDCFLVPFERCGGL